MPISQLRTANIPSTSLADNSTPDALAGKAGEAIVAELHGKYYTQTYRGNVFVGTTAIGGITPATSAATAEATTSTGEASEAYLEAATEVSGLSGELNKLIDTINKANGVGQDAVTTNAAYEKTLVDAQKELESFAAANGKSAKNLDESTAAGSQNASTLADLAASSQAAAKAQFDLDHNTEAYTARLEQGRKEIYNTALALTGNAKAAQALTDKIYAMPSQKEIDILADTSRAENELRRLSSKWQGQTIKLRATVDGKLGSGILTGENRASGGAIYGPGGPTDDKAGRFNLSNGEHVLTAADVDALGGQSGVYAMRQSLHNTYATPAAPVYAGRGGSGGGSVIITVPVTIKSLAVDNPDLLARTVTSSVKEALRNGAIPTDWNNA